MAILPLWLWDSVPFTFFQQPKKETTSPPSPPRRFFPWQSFMDEVLSKAPPQVLPTLLVRSHYLPSSSDRSAIEAIIASCESTTGALEAEKHHLRAATAIIQQRISHYDEFKRMQHSLLSPIRKLPNEVLSEIFAFVCGKTINIADCTPGGIWDLQQVCVRWRIIAQSTSSLWSDFEIEGAVPTMVKTATAGTIAWRVQSCLKHSGKAPLTISFITHTSQDIPISIVEDVANHSDRWIDIAVDASVLEKAAKETIMEASIKLRGLSQLRHLHLEHRNSYLSSSWKPSHVFRGATGLEEVCLYGITLPDEEFPWNNVKSLSLLYCDVESEEMLYSALRSMPFLEKLRFNGEYTDLEPQQPQQSRDTVLPSLHTLIIESNDGDDVSFPLLRLPHLSTLQIDGHSFDVRPMLETVRMSTNLLKNLELTMWNSADYIFNIFEGIRDIERVSLAMSTVEAQKLLLKLTQDPINDLRSSQLLPSLRKFELNTFSSSKMPSGIVSSLANLMRFRSSTSPAMARGQLAAPLSFIKLVMTFPTKAECDFTIDRLKTLGEEFGVEVDVRGLSIARY